MYGASYLQRGVSCCLGTVCGRDRALIFGRMADYMIRRVRDIGGQHQELRVDIHVDTGSEPPAVLQEIFECLESPVSERASERASFSLCGTHCLFTRCISPRTAVCRLLALGSGCSFVPWCYA